MPEKSFGLPSPEILAEPVAPDAAIEFWKERAKLTDKEAKALGEGAKHRAFYVTGLAEHDLVQLVSDGLEEALKNGETLADFKERIAAAIQAQGWHDYRVENIFRTNMQTAYAAGRYKKMQAVKKTRPYWQYVAVMDKRVRPSHAILHEKVYPADHEFWNSNYPPNGFRCRCGVITLSERQVKAQGLTVETKMPEPDMWTDPKTGMEYFVHFPGADKGFKNNPGKDWAEAGLDLKKYPDVNEKSYKKLRGPAASAPDVVEKALGITKGIPEDYVEAVIKVNPNFSKGGGYQNNCQRCVPAYELRRRGYTVEAMPKLTTGASASGIRNGNECYKNAPIRGCYGGTPKLTKTDLLKELNSLPDGARMGILWEWPGRRSAHTIVCEKNRGTLIFMDPQTGKVGDFTLGNADRTTGYSWYRMDNKDLVDNFLWNDVVKAAKK